MREINKSNQTKLSEDDIKNINIDYFFNNMSYNDICKKYKIGSGRLKKILTQYKENNERKSVEKEDGYDVLLKSLHKFSSKYVESKEKRTKRNDIM